MTYCRWGLVALLLGGVGCVVERVKAPVGLGSFALELISVDDFPRNPGCEDAPVFGSKACLRPFPEASQPVTVRLKVRALDTRGAPLAWEGSALLDVRPGELPAVGPGGRRVALSGGVSEEVVMELTHAYGEVRFWAEDCGSSAEPGTFATGVSAPLFFEAPRIDQLNATVDNAISPLTPRASNACVITGDPRYGLGTDRDGESAFVGYSHGGAVNAPPPAVGNFVEIVGCTRAEHDAAVATGGSCERGPLVVTGITNEGFFISDVNARAMATGFNHLYIFNYHYPEDLVVGDIVTRLRGSPVEFSGSTQMGHPVWEKDGSALGVDLLPAPVKMAPQVYKESLRSYGRNRSDALTLEKLEGAVVCLETVAPASRLVECDMNSSGQVERNGCLLDSFDAPLPPLCSSGSSGLAPAPPACDVRSERPFCLDMASVAERFIQLEPGRSAGMSPEAIREEKSSRALAACGLKGYLPGNPAEYCCERLCYNDFSCSDESALVSFGQWAGEVSGRYEAAGPGGEPVKLGFITRDAAPEFDAMAFGRQERGKPVGERRRVRVMGHLRHVLAARPVWVVMARYPSDVEVGGVCP